VPTSMQWNFAPSREFNGDWRGYFGEYTSALRDIKTEREENPVRNEILVPRHSVEVAELPKVVQDVVRLHGGHWKAQHSQTWHEGAVFKSGAREGEKRPDKTVDHYAIGLVGKSPLTAVWSGGKMQYAKGVRDGELLWTESVNELKSWLKGGWE
jgi:hypothetical protein